MGEAINSRTGAALTVTVVSDTFENAKKIADRLQRGLNVQGVTTDKVTITAAKLNGFKEVKTGSANIPVEP